MKKRVLTIGLLMIWVISSGFRFGTFKPHTLSMTQAEADRLDELVEQGYTGPIGCDQLDEEFRHMNGRNGTGGIDGLLLDGTPATGNKTPSNPEPHTHNWVEEVIKEATCQEEGEMKLTCSGCGKEKIVKTAKLDHNYEVVSENPGSCVEHPSVTYKCTMCGEEKVVEEDTYADHTYILSNDSKEATCEEPGHLIYVCSVCGDTYEENPEALGHDWEEKYTVDQKPTCEAEGTESIHCSRCGAVQEGTSRTIPALGHSEKTPHTVVEPTFWKEGRETVYCENCGKVLKETVLPATGGIYRIIIPAGAGVLVLIIVTVVILLTRKKK